MPKRHLKGIGRKAIMFPFTKQKGSGAYQLQENNLVAGGGSNPPFFHMTKKPNKLLSGISDAAENIKETLQKTDSNLKNRMKY